jgi:hypothetical protein
VLRDALTNDIEVVSHQDDFLIHDRPISREGLRWRKLQAWCAESCSISDEKVAKETLYQRLQGNPVSASPRLPAHQFSPRNDCCSSSTTTGCAQRCPRCPRGSRRSALRPVDGSAARL